MKNRIQNLPLLIIFSIITLSSQRLVAQSQGPNNPNSAANETTVIPSLVTWTSGSRITASDDQYATMNNGTSKFLLGSDYGFSIPTGAIINGIKAEVEMKGTTIATVTSSSWTSFTSTNYSSGTATANYGTTNYSYNLPVARTTNDRRMLVVTIGIENVDNTTPGQDPSIAFTTVKYNNVNMTLLGTASLASTGTSNNVAVYYMLDTDLPATVGSRSISITKTFPGESSGSISSGEFAEIVGAAVFSNVNQVTPITPVTSTAASTSIVSPTISNIRYGDYLVAATMNNTPSGSGGSVTPQSGFTENMEVTYTNTSTSASGAILEVQSKSVTTSGTPNATISATGASASRLEMVAFSVNGARVYDNSVRLLTAGLQVGNDYGNPTNSLPDAWPDNDTYISYGGPTDLWGSVWTPAIINSSSFGLAFQTIADRSNAYIDNIRLTVYYSIPLAIAPINYTILKEDSKAVASFSFKSTDAEYYTLVLEKAGEDVVFKSIDSIMIQGKMSIQNFKITDENPFTGINYYRIKIKGETVTYTEIKTFYFGYQSVEVSAYPNPATDYLILYSPSTVNSISLIDATGAVHSAKITADNNQYKIENLPAPGSYMILVNTESGVSSKKILIN